MISHCILILEQNKCIQFNSIQYLLRLSAVIIEYNIYYIAWWCVTTTDWLSRIWLSHLNLYWLTS